MSKVRKVAKRVSDHGNLTAYGLDPVFIGSIIMGIFKCLAERQNPKPPTPPVSLGVETDEEKTAWATACSSHQIAVDDYVENDGDYSRQLLARTMREVKQDYRRDGKKTTKAERETIARQILDEARTTPWQSPATVR